ncbi:uncharacterized protein PV06_10444 [Exophiala oligosperma]|uniref:Uncharacterized protein n=1 Tax=Exophiala oligosperma TaxID=215243 RepID=A0A0D2AAM8_9EURO|nr:uncharacterized protein PV06_10444 [Exophiala oligosperma]KIW37401.1 hypothetical protein PV06_10444 [Exophiala oligosperma]
MLEKFRSNFSHRPKKEDDEPSPTPKTVERNLSPKPPLSWMRRKSSGSLATLLSHRPSNSSLISGDEAEDHSTDYEMESLGLRAIHEPEGRPIADIIFVHGLGGHSYKTWSKDRDRDFFWPGLWLPKDPKIGRARLFTYGYNSGLTGPKTVSNIMGFARSLLFDMRYSRGQQSNSIRIGDVPIIFVAHSMGGLVVKKAYLMAQHDNSCQELARSISGIIFLSTPHRGSSLANTLDLILRSILQPKRPFIKELERNSSAIEDINEEFRHVAPKLSIISFYEELHTVILSQPLMIVTRDSAILGYENEQTRGLNADHHTICKFENDRDPSFKIVRDVVKGLVEKFSTDVIKPAGTTNPRTISLVKRALGMSRTDSEDLDSLRKLWIPGSCEWILTNSTIRVWLEDASRSHLVWYNAPPASGKSVLSSYLVHYLQSEGYACQYYFFSQGDQTRRSIGQFLKSMACQICRMMPDYAEELLAFSTGESQLSSGGYLSLWQTLFEDMLFARTSDYPLFWIVDGLDESDSASKVLELLENVLSRSKLTIKILATGRRTDKLSLMFRKLQRLVVANEIDGAEHNHNSHDIQLLVDRELELMHGSMEHKARLRQDILTRANGNFLWVSLVLEELHKCQTESESQLTLEQIPADMTKMYERMEQLVIDNPNPRQVELAKELLRWTICVPTPLKLNELQEAVSKNYPDIIELEKTIRAVCGQFILVDSTKHVMMVHQTARDFMTNASKSVIAIDRQVAHSTLLIKSLSALCDVEPYDAVHRQKRHMPGLEELEKHQPFLLYAANSWFYHLKYADPIADNVIDALEKFFSSPYVLDWIYSLAMLDQVKLLAKVGKALLGFVIDNRKHNNSRNPMLHRLSSIELLESWSADLVKITAKFSNHLVIEPYSIYDIVPAMCPPGSIIGRLFVRPKSAKALVSGQSDSWNDISARLSLQEDDVALKIVSAGPHIAVLAQGGIIYIWSSADFREICRIDHGEAVTSICLNAKGNILVTYGLKLTKVWEVPSRVLHTELANHCNTKAMCLAFAMKDQRILAANDDNSIRYFDISEKDGVWKALNDSLMKEESQSDSVIINSPSCMAMNPACTQLGVCYRSFPLTVWDLSSGTIVSRCMRRTVSPFPNPTSVQSWFPVEVFAWNPTTGHILGWYKGNRLFKWHPLTDETHEVSALVDELVCSPDGKVVLTSDSNGTVKIWNFTYLTVVYQLSSGDLVSGLSFSPNCTRFYDIRGSLITAWEPNALLRLAEAEDNFSDSLSHEQRGTVISRLSEVTAPQYSSLTALAAAPGGLLFATGNEDGEVWLSSIQSGIKSEVTRFYNFQCVSHLIWGSSSEVLVAADLATDVHILQISNLETETSKGPETKRLADPSFNLEGRAIHQMLLDTSSRRLLAISNDLVQAWDIFDSVLTESNDSLMDAASRYWCNHSSDRELFIGVGPEDIQVFEWSSLQQVSCVMIGIDTHMKIGPNSSTVLRIDEQSTSMKTVTRTIRNARLSQDGKHILIEIKEATGRGRSKIQHLVITTKELAATLKGGDGVILDSLQIPDEVAQNIDVALAIFPGEQLVFLDRNLWLCSMKLSQPLATNAFKRHYFIPRDWTDEGGLQQCCVVKDGTLLCPQDGNVVVVRSHVGL